MISKLFLLVSSLLLYFLCLILVPVYRRFAVARGVLDVPSQRSSHQGITPRGGGVVFAGLWTLTLILGWMTGVFSIELLLSFLPGVLLVGALGYWDDNQSLPPRFRLLGQGLSSFFFLLSLLALGSAPDALGIAPIAGGNTISTATLSGLYIPDLHIFSFTPLTLGSFSWIIWIFTLIGVVWSINLFNFMDGIDGLASIEAIFVLGVGGFICWMGGAPELALLAWAMVALLIGFLVWNWPKAEIFMGDVGSYTLGFLIAAFAVAGDIWYNIPIAFWIILYALFWVDATLTLVRRIYYKKHWATAHKEHAYQRLHQAGFSPAKILGIAVVVNTVLAGMALWGYYYPEYLHVALLLSLLWVSLWYAGCEYLKPQKRGSG